MEKLKVAVIHDWLNGMRGGEKVLQEIISLFPQADIYTLFLEKDKISEKIRNQKIFTSGLNKNFLIKKHYKSFLGWFPRQIEMFDLRGYDLVISSSHCVAKGVIPPPEALHICYIYSPMRYIWDQHFEYFGNTRGLKGWYIKKQCHKLRVWDSVSSKRVDNFIAISSYIKKRVNKYYRRKASIIFPPVDTDFYVPVSKKKSEPYFLTVCALVPYKRVDLTVRAFNENGKKLIVVGKGSEEKNLKKLAGSNITFRKNLSQNDLRDLYQNAAAFVFSGVEDFGIAFVESQACGIPVIALNCGGVTDIVNEKTGILFEDQNIETITRAVAEFDNTKFDQDKIRQNSLKFSQEVFKTKLLEYILDKLND